MVELMIDDVVSGDALGLLLEAASGQSSENVAYLRTRIIGDKSDDFYRGLLAGFVNAHRIQGMISPVSAKRAMYVLALVLVEKGIIEGVVPEPESNTLNGQTREQVFAKYAKMLGMPEGSNADEIMSDLLMKVLMGEVPQEFIDECIKDGEALNASEPDDHLTECLERLKKPKTKSKSLKDLLVDLLNS